MFICEKCYGEHASARLFRSQGACEMCGSLSACLDVPPKAQSAAPMTPTRRPLAKPEPPQ